MTTYTPQSWATGDQVTAVELTDLSGAVVSASSGIADMSIDQSTSHLQVTLADGDLVDAGAVPAATDATVAPILQDTASASYAAAQSAAQGYLAPQGVITPTAVSHAAVQAALTNAATNGGRVIAGGSYTTDQTLTITSSCDLSALTINYTGTSTAVVVGQSASMTQRLWARLPRVANSNKTANGWSQAGVTGTVGVDVVNCYACILDVPYVASFATGLQVRGAQSNGTQQTAFNLGQLDNNQINIVFTGDSTGWANQDYFFGGRCSHNSSEGAQVTGTRHVQFQNLANPINGHAFYGTSLESPNVVEYHIEAANAQWCTFYGSRFENTGGNTSRRILSSGNAKYNRLAGGAYVADITQVVQSAAQPFDIDSAELTTRRGGSITEPAVTFENIAGSTSPVLSIMAAGAGAANADPAAAYGLQMSSQALSGKRPTDPAGQDRVRMDALNGRLWLGDGTAAPKSYLMGTGTFFLFGGATTVGPLTDGAASLGSPTNYRFAYVRAQTAVVTGSGATSARPAAATAGAGAMWFDTTLSKPIWSTGAGWVDATGTAV